MKNKKELIRQILEAYLNKNIHELQFTNISGGCINECFKISTENSDSFFLKLNSANKFPDLFKKEKNGLEFLAQQNLIKVPAVIACGETGDDQYLILEWIEQGRPDEEFWKDFGSSLAKLNSVTHHSFGFFENNYMGSIVQSNNVNPDWNNFFIEQRLEPQVALAGKNAASLRKAFENLYKLLPSIFDKSQPSLLHGDLWSGNFICDKNKKAVLIDPAVYFGHTGVDTAMSTLFGGFDPLFYDAYNYQKPFPKNYREQWDVVNLYPLLIHLNLFGESYLPQIERILKNFVKS